MTRLCQKRLLTQPPARGVASIRGSGEEPRLLRSPLRPGGLSAVDWSEGAMRAGLTSSEAVFATSSPRTARPRPAWRDDVSRRSGLFDPHLRQQDLAAVERRKLLQQRHEERGSSGVVGQLPDVHWQDVWSAAAQAQCGGVRGLGDVGAKGKHRKDFR